MGLLKKNSSVLSTPKYKKKGSSLTPTQLSALNMGAIVFQKHKYFCDCLETGLASIEKKYVSGAILGNHYNVFDKESAIKIMKKLDKGFHSMIFDALRPVLIGESTEPDLSSFDEEVKELYTDEQGCYMEELFEEMFYYLTNLQESSNLLVENNFIMDLKDFESISLCGWDMGRIVLVARWSYERGFLTEVEAWTFIEKAHNKCKLKYDNWNDFATSYIVGRAMWRGLDEDFSSLVDITRALLKDPESPWVENKF